MKMGERQNGVPSVEDRLIFDDDSGVGTEGGVLFAVLFEDSTVFLGGVGFCCFFFFRGVSISLLFL